MDNLNLRIGFKGLLTFLLQLLLIASAFGQNGTNETTTAMVTVNATNSTNATSTGAPTHGGGLYLGSLLACYLCIFLCRLLLTV
ncbi:hypothetical protein D4764_06G0002160 [Takifugu flavidus]|uniref:Uncharacterized protein n=1 Tax=Takifugu flavidus TaxID=433684 RepID=A0A5C6MUC9_9TELE|nr:hypothetical protein D4764_06G0002160 [Takifugu flavidus]